MWHIQSQPEKLRTGFKYLMRRTFQYLFFFLMAALVSFHFINKNDWYIQNFEQAKWNKIEIDKEKKSKLFNEWLEKINALDAQECAILVRAKELTSKIEIERRTLIYNQNKDNAEIAKDVTEEISEYRNLCNELGEPPYISRDLTIIEIVHARKNLKNGIITDREFEVIRANALKENVN